MSERTNGTEAPTDRLVTWMAVAAILITLLSILFPRFPASLSIAVDTLLVLLISALANEGSLRDATVTRRAAAPERSPHAQPAAEGTPAAGSAPAEPDLQFRHADAILVNTGE